MKMNEIAKNALKILTGDRDFLMDEMENFIDNCEFTMSDLERETALLLRLASQIDRIADRWMKA